MSKYEEAIELKAELSDYQNLAKQILLRIKFEMLTSDPNPSRKEIEMFNQILEAINTLTPQIIEIVCAQQRIKVKKATETAWQEMSDLFKDFTISLSQEVADMRKKIDNSPIPGAMP